MELIDQLGLEDENASVIGRPCERVDDLEVD